MKKRKSAITFGLFLISTSTEIDDSPGRFRSTGTQLKTREIANLISPGDAQVFTLLTSSVASYLQTDLKYHVFFLGAAQPTNCQYDNYLAAAIMTTGAVGMFVTM